MSLKITINNEEVVCNNNIKIKEEMLSTSSTILRNCYPKTWELDKDYVSRYYFPKDYSKCKITNDTYHPEEPGTIVKGSNLNINYNNTKRWELKGLYGNTSQNGTPTPSSPVEIQNVTGLQNIEVCGKNLFDKNKCELVGGVSFNNTENHTYTITSGTSRNFVIIKVQPSTIYTISVNRSRAYLGELKTKTTEAGNGSNSWIYSEKTFTTTPRTNYIGLLIDMADLTNFTMQVEQGSATEYEPYKGNTYEVNLGKNLLDLSKFYLITADSGITLTNDTTTGKITLNGTATKNTFITYLTQKFNSGEVISLSANNPIINSNVAIRMYDISSAQTSSNIGLNTINKKSEGITLNRSFDGFQVRIASGTTLSNFELFPQIEIGNTVSSFSPYFTPIELNKIGNYEDKIYKQDDKWYIEKNIQKVVITGSTAGIYQSGNLTNVMRMAVPSGYNLGGNSSSLFCDKLKVDVGYNHDYEQIYVSNNNFYVFVAKSRGVTDVNTFKTWLNSNNLNCYVVLSTPTTTEITNEDLLNQLESIYYMNLKNGVNNIISTSENLPILLEIHYNYHEAYTNEDLIFCGCVKNTGKISLNPREPHFVDLQVLDFKTLLSEGETLNYVITGKTIVEAINQVVNSISDYGFVVGNIKILNPNDIINAYSTLNKTAYDVFQYIADITQSRWTTRMIDENTIAIDFYDPTLMPTGTPIESTQAYYENNQIIDINFNYSTNDYRNKQIMTSDEVYANITQTETIIADGYATSFMCENKIGTITSITLNDINQTFITKNEEQLGYSGDFVYQPGENTFISSNSISAGGVIVITYYAIVKGREIIINSSESSRIETQVGRKGIISRYENRNDSTSSVELQKIGQSYIKYKGNAEIQLKVKTKNNLWNVGEILSYNAPLEELSNEYMVKSKEVDWYAASNETFYIYELTSNFNYENAVNYFDNQRAKNQGNIGESQTISRNIDLESTALIKFYDTAINEVQIQNPTSLDFALDGVLI